MRHRKVGRGFGMDASHRKSVLRSLVTSVVLHGSVTTTEARAKEVRRFVERVVTVAKAGRTGEADRPSVAAVRLARLWVIDDVAVEKLFSDYAVRYVNRPGGYTRVVHAGNRAGDNARMAVIEFVT
jgi:large subunit ribosomal protein L17